MNKRNQAIVIAFIIPIYLLSVFKLVWPDRSVSEQENRRLAQKPALSWASIASGQFTSDFESWFTDQFPFRNFFMDVNNRTETMLQLNIGDEPIVLIQGPVNDLGTGEQLFQDGDETVGPSEPDDIQEGPETDPSLNPDLTKGSDPDHSNNPLTNPDSTRNEAETQTPIETTRVRPAVTPPPEIDAPVENYSAVIIVNKMAMEIYGFNQGKADTYIALINQLQARLPNAQVYSMIAPTSIEFYAPAKYSSLSSSQKNAIDYVYSGLDPSVRTVDVYSWLYANWQEYIYFRSDHHWTARGAYHGYEAYCQAAGLTPVPLSDFIPGTIPGDFLGSLYRYTQSADLKSNPDRVDYYEPQTLAEGFAFQDSLLTNGRTIELIKKNTSQSSQYLAFIEGDHPIARFSTSLQNGRKVLVVKESYGNAFVPYLANHYQEIYVVDPRKIQMNLPAFIHLHNIQDVVVVNYSFGVSNKSWVEGFAALIG